jgi:CheY-like chemotaxis protein
MPGMDGYGVAARIRAEPWGSAIVLVALTGWGLDEHRRRAHEGGFDAHLNKPVDRASLEAVVRKLGAPV